MSIKDPEYKIIVKDILENKEFLKLKDIEHHGTTRFIHSTKVSYISYKIAKFLRLDYEKTARGGLMHDFFFSPEHRCAKERSISFFAHPPKALALAKSQFNLSKKEEDMIISHMFPSYPSLPKYLETWIISFVDKGVAIQEFSVKFSTQFKFKLKYAYNLFLIFAIGIIK